MMSDTIDQREVLDWIRRNGRPWQTIETRSPLYIAPHVAHFDWLGVERNVVHFDHDGADIEWPPSNGQPDPRGDPVSTVLDWWWR
jgi:hypothetical protein